MKREINIPSLGESISAVTVGRFLVAEGSLVQVDQEIAELETDKVNQMLYAPCSGKISFSVRPGEKMAIGGSIGFIEEASDQEPKAATQALPAFQKGQEPLEVRHPIKAFSDSLRVTREDFLQDLLSPKEKIKEVCTSSQIPPQEEKTASLPRETRRPLSSIRRVIGEKMVEAKQKTAMLTTFNEVDMSALMLIREKHQEAFMKKQGVKLGLMSFFVKASLFALQAFPDVNSYIDASEIVHREYFDIGVAVSTDRGVVVPVLRNCERLSFAKIEQEIERLAKRAREGALALSDLQGAGFTITNGGVFGSLLSTPLLLPPQCAILGMHKIEKRAVVRDDQIVIRPMMYVALSYDHRLIDGKEAVSFLVQIKNLLEDPSRILLEI